MPALRWLWRGASRIGVRLLVLNTVVLLALAVVLLASPVLEPAFLRDAHRALDGEAEILAAAVSATPGLRSGEIERLLREVKARSASRARIVDAEGWLVADTQRLELSPAPDEAPGSSPEDAPRLDERVAAALLTWIEARRRANRGVLGKRFLWLPGGGCYAFRLLALYAADGGRPME